MKQMRLPTQKAATVPAKQAAEDEANLGAARIILADRSKYAGLQVEWAERVVARKHGKTEPFPELTKMINR